MHEIGHGGMATVYLARDVRLGTQVAVKMLSPDLSPVLGAERFTREIRITSSLDHPGILPVLDAGEFQGQPFYVMPFVAGESLADRLRHEGPLPIPEAIEVACQVADALALAHRHGFVHRDIKPSNILFTHERAIVADFGIARAIDLLTSEKLTESGVALGTAAYMSPEQSSGGRVDGRSDLYSLGCVLFEMLAGAPPFSGASSQSVRARHLVDPVPSLHTVRDTVAPALERIIVRAMAKLPADRYPDMEQFIEALRQVDLDQAGVVVSGDTGRRRPRRRLLAALGIAVAIAGAAAASRFAFQRPAPLDRNRVLVFPLVVPTEFAGSRTMGEDVSALIGNALDGVGRLRWIDGWPLLDPRVRDDIRSLPLESARALANQRRCAFFVTGRLVARGDSAEVFLELNDAAGDSVVARGSAGGPLDGAWRLGLAAINEVLPAIIPTGAPDVADEWKAREPAAVASYLLGEAAFRRLQLGDALTHYRAAVRADSGFGLAAIRGAQAATWNHRSSEAASLIATALRRPLSSRYRHFALGYEAYLEGRPDSAAAELHRALADDPEMTVAWMQLGEVYTHLLPEAGSVDSLAEDALETAHQLDPRATILLLHLIEIRLRQGDTARAAPLARTFLAANPDTSRIADQVRIMDACVRRGPASVDWKKESQKDRLAVLSAGKALAGGGSQLQCVTPAMEAVIRDDTSRQGDDRYFALLILQAGLLAMGRASDAATWISASPAEDDAETLLLMDAPVYPEVAERARALAGALEAACGPEYARCGSPSRVWKLALWEAHAGQAERASAAAAELARRAAATEPAGSEQRLIRIQARSALAHAALARGDTAATLAVLQTQLREPVPGGLELDWDVARPRGLDRLVLARLFLARGDARRALETANVLDSPRPLFLIYVPASLRLRVQAAEALGDTELAARFRARLAALAPPVSLAVSAVPSL